MKCVRCQNAFLQLFQGVFHLGNSGVLWNLKTVCQQFVVVSLGEGTECAVKHAQFQAGLRWMMMDVVFETQLSDIGCFGKQSK